MSNFQTVSAGMLTSVPLMCALPGAATASPIRAATPSDANAGGTEIIVSPDQHTTHIQGGVQIEQNLFHHFDVFNVELGHTANFVTAEQTAAVIGQVSGGSRSHIDGTLQITGSEADLYLLNPAGVLFGPNAHLNLGGSFTATTASQVGFGDAWLTVENTIEKAPDYSAFDQSPTAYRFEGAAAVVNQADLAVVEGEAIRFIGGGVANTGTLSAPGGEVTLSAVESDRLLVRLTTEGSLLSVEVDAAAAGGGFGAQALPELLTGQNAPDATDLRVNGDGSVTLLSREQEPSVVEGAVFTAGRVDVSATEPGKTGGQVNLLGMSVTVEEAQLSADGAAGGGLIRVGGDYQGQGTMPAAEQVVFEGEASANALVAGDGGQVVLWSEGTTQFAGLLSAQGAGEGKGGLVETSGFDQLVVDARSQVTTAAPSGDFGTWLLDPVDLSVVAAGGTATIAGGTNSPAAASTVDAATLVSALDGSNVTLQATNSVTVDAPIDASGNAAGGDLFFQTPALNLNEGIALRAGSLLSGQPTTVNVGPSGLLQNAVDAVATGGTVNLSAATYQGAETVINRDMTLRGQGTGSTLLTGDSAHRVVRIDGGIVGIDGVTIFDGAADRGGGILVQNAASVLLTNSELRDNSALEPGVMTGGGLHLAGAGTSLIRDTRFENNTASDGGAISQNDTHDVLIQNSEFINNRAQQDGGAIDNRTTNSGLTIRNSLFSANEALQEGGAIAVQDALFLFDSRLENNSAAEAGALFFRDLGSSSITRTTLDSNQSTSSAGAIALVDRHNLTIEQSTLSNNIAGSMGGAIVSAISVDANLEITNSTFSGNQATTAGGGLFIEPGRDVSLTNVTVTNNQTGTGGGLSIAPGGSVELASSIVSGNMAAVSADIDGVIVSQGNNIVGDRGASTGYVATDLPTGTDPRLGVLTDNGGPTWTHALLLNSPAHDRGVGIGMDQRGVNASGLRDIGAYERLSPDSFVFTSGDGQSAVVDTLYADPVEVQVLDFLGGTLDGIDVTFSTKGSVAGSDVTFERPAVLTTDANGLVSMPIRANTVAGPVNVRARTPSLPREFVRVNNVADVPAQLTVTGGNNQSTVVNTAFADQISVEVSDRFGNIVEGARVDFSVPSTGPSGTLSDLFHITGSSGEGHTDVTANTLAGDFSVLAEVGALSTTVDLRNLADAAHQLVLSGMLPVSITAGDSTGFTITAYDQFGNVATGYTGTVDFSSSDSQAQLPPPTVLTDGTGTFAGEPRTAGNHSLTIADTLDPALSVTQNGIVVVPDAPSELTVVSGDNQQAVVDTGFADGIVLQARDRFGNATPGESIALAAPASGPSSFLSTPTVMTNAQGQGVFNTTANTVAGDHTVLAELGGLSQTLSLENLADVASQLVLSGQPAAVAAGDVNTVTVTARDRFGNLADSYGGTVAIASSDGQAQLPETSVLTAGTGSFTTEFRTVGVQALSAIDTVIAGLGTTQEGIAVSHGVAHSLEIVGGSDQFAVASTDFPEALTVQVRDRFGNPVIGEPVTFLVPTAGPSAVLELATAITDSSGQATTALAANNQVGVYIVEATTTGLRQVVGLTNTAPGSIPPASTLEVLPNNLLPEEEEGAEQLGRLGLFDEVAFAQLEESLTEEYARYWQRPLKKSMDLSAVQQILQQAEETHQARSGIVYAVFVPPSEPDSVEDARYSAALSRRLLSNEATAAQDELLLLFIPPEGDPVQQRVPVSRQQIQRLATFFNLEVSSFLNDGYKPLARELYRWLLEPVEEDIQKANVDDLMYVMDEGLSAVPLPAMMTGDTFAIERYGFSVLPSVGLLQTDFGSAPAEQTLLAGGADTFSELEALPAVPVELEIVESIATSAEVLLNEEFEVENLRTAQAIAPKTMMHVATHAAFNPGALDRSYIQFWDEQLTLDGLDSLGLEGLELLILSACTTAAGSREAELGFAGLAAVTGVEASIGSLWQISDIGTMALMAEFYEQLQADPLRFSALRKAQLSLLRGDTRIEDNRLITQQGETPLPADLVSQGEAHFSHPFFWSGFTLVGNPWW